MRRMAVRVAVLVVIAALAVGLGACKKTEDSGSAKAGCAFNPPDEKFPTVDQPGVTDTEIRVGALIGKTNPVGRPYEDAVKGAEAYFCKINEQGGLYGRELKIVAVRDDQSRASANQTQARALVEEDNVFAVLPVVTNTFTGAEYLNDAGVPTFGWAINAEWADKPALFGEKGSVICFDCITISPSFVADQIGATKSAILTYTVKQSTDCAKGLEAGFAKYGPPVGYEDTTLSFGFTPAQIAPAVQEMKDAGVDLVATCMDVNGNVTVAKALKQAGMNDVAIFSPEGYDPTVPEKFGADLDNFYFAPEFVPFELADENKPIAEFVDAMDKRDVRAGELALAGWIDANMFVGGLKAAGSDFTREKLIASINAMKAFDADGVRPPIDWTISHSTVQPLSCNAYVKAEDGKFVPVFGQKGKPFVCFPYGLEDSDFAATLDNPEYQ